MRGKYRWLTAVIAAGALLVPSVMSQAASAPVQVSFWYGLGGQQQKDIQTLISKFNNSHPSIHVNGYFAGGYGANGPEQQKVEAAIASGKVPTLVQLEIHAICEFGSSGALMNLAPWMKTSAHDKASDFIPGLMVNTGCQGKTYGVPFNRSVPILYYNRAMFKKAGIAGPPKTWAELQIDAKKLTKNGVVGFEPVNQWWFYEAMTWSDGGHILNKSLTKAAFDSPQGAKGMALWVQMVKDKVAKVNFGPNDFIETIQDFLNQKTAMYWGSAADMAFDDTAKFPWGAAYSPKFTKLSVPTGGADAVIMAKAPLAQREAAWTFVQWWTAVPQTTWWSEQTGYLPVLTAALKSPEMQSFFKKNPNHEVPVYELAYARQAPLSTHYYNVLQDIQNAQDNIMDFSQTPAAALKQAAQQANQALAGQ